MLHINVMSAELRRKLSSRRSSSKWQKAHRAEKLEYDKQYGTANHTSLLEKSRAYKAAHPEKGRNRLYGKGAYKHLSEQLVKQENRCGICHKEFVSTPHQDHDHETKQLRGALCNRCNLGIGQFEDSVERLQSAIEYLKFWTTATRNSCR